MADSRPGLFGAIRQMRAERKARNDVARMRAEVAEITAALPAETEVPVEEITGERAERLREFLRGTPHPFALDAPSMLCVCGLVRLHEAHDPDSLLDPRAVLNGTGGPRERMARALAAQAAQSAEWPAPRPEISPEQFAKAAGQNLATATALLPEPGPSPSGVLGWLVGCIDEYGRFRGTTHTTPMTLEAARHEAKAHGVHMGRRYFPVEIREANDDR